MFKRIIGKGIMLGAICGIATTLFDSLYMLSPDIHVPRLYPLYLIIFNMFFWSFFGALSGCAVRMCFRAIKRCAANEHLLWTVFYLVPFACIFIYFCLADTPIIGLFETVPYFSPSFSFFWPLAMLAFLILRLYRSAPRAPFTPFFFVPEIITILILAHFSANAAQLDFVSMPYRALEPFFKSMGMERPGYLVAAYVTGIALLCSMYLIIFFMRGRYYAAAPPAAAQPRKSLLSLGAAFAAMTCFVAAVFTTTGPERIHLDTGDNYRSGSDAMPVILIVLDTVRADHLSVYGYPSVHRHLEAFSKDALVFDRCIANSPWTLPSHASLFTGLHPSQHGAHGVLDGGNIKIGDFEFGLIPRPLDDSFVTLAEIFQDNGYRTMAVVANNTVLGKDLNLHQGYETYECFGNIGFLNRTFPLRPVSHYFAYLAYIPDFFMDTMRASHITERCMRAVDASANSAFFLFVNYMDAHEEYCPPRPYNRHYTDRKFPHLVRLKRSFLNAYPQGNSRQAWDNFLISQYDGAISYLDDQLGGFFEHLKRSGIYERALIIVTSDHGELFGEHGLYAHTTPMYEGVVRVPLMIKLPQSRLRGRDTDRHIQLHDLFATILSVCGLPVPENTVGRSFGSPSSPVVGEFENAKIRKHRVIYDGSYKYLSYERERPEELYDLDADPMEQRNLAAEHPAIAENMAERLRQWADAHQPLYEIKKTEVPAETLRALKGLGYLK